MVSSWPLCLHLARRPVGGAWPRITSIGGAIRAGGLRAGALPVLGALVWTTGTTLNFVAGIGMSSQAVAYAIAQAAPMVAALWGVVAFREFRGAPWTAWLALVLMFAAYASAVVVLALSSGKM